MRQNKLFHEDNSSQNPQYLTDYDSDYEPIYKPNDDHIYEQEYVFDKNPP